MNGGWWGQIKFGLFFGIGLIGAGGLAKLVLWLLNTIFGGGSIHTNPLAF